MKRLFFILIALSTSALASEPDAEGWIEKIKTYNLTFDSKGMTQVNIVNQYGNVKVLHWDKKQVKADITVKANAASNAQTEAYLNSTEVKGNVKNGVLYLHTVLSNNALGQNTNRKVNYLTVTYTVYMPKDIKLNVDNKFGDIILPAFSAPLQVNLQHGTLKAPAISNTSSNVDIKFSSAQIKELVGATLKAVNSTVNLHKAQNADIKSEKGVFVAEILENIKAELNYTKTSLNELGKDIELDLRFINDLKLGELNNDLNQLIINTNYSDIQIPASNAKVSVKTTNGQFYIGQGVDAKIKKDVKASTANTKVFDAVIGEDDTPKRVITIKANNGDVKIKQ
jgi:hypothetical protein